MNSEKLYLWEMSTEGVLISVLSLKEALADKLIALAYRAYVQSEVGSVSKAFLVGDVQRNKFDMRFMSRYLPSRHCNHL